MVIKVAQNVSLPNAQYNPPDVDLESVKSPAKSASWYRPNLQSLPDVTSMTIMSVVSSVMNVADSYSQSLVACPVPFRHMSCQVVHC